MSSHLHAGTSRPALDEDEDIERKKVREMRALVEARHPSAKELDNATIRRFLRARNLDVEKGSSMLIKHLQWRKEFVPKGYFSAEEVVGSGLCNKETFLHGLDKIGRPISVILAGRHKPITNVDDFKRYVVYCVDKVCSRIPSGQEKFVGIMDMKGYGFANNDIRAFITALSLLQDNYPERLGKMLFVHVPQLFMAAWKIISPFVDKNTKKKITFVEGKKMKATMLEDIEESQLPEIYGGKLKLVSIEQS